MGSLGIMEEPDEAETDTANDDALFAQLRGWVKTDREAMSAWRKEAEDCYRFPTGDHWSDDDKRAFIDTGRQPVVYNRVGPIVDAICGLEVNNRQEVKYLPRTQGDVQKNELLSALAQWARDEAQAEDEESDAFRDALTCGLGVTETRMDYSDGDAKIVVDRCDPLEMVYDAGASKANLVDRRRTARIRTMSCEVAKEMFPDKDIEALNAAWAAMPTTRDGGEGNKLDYPNETRASLKGSANPKEITLVEIEWWETVREMLVAVTTEAGEAEETIAESEWPAAEERLKALGVQYQTAKQQRRVYKYAVLGSSGIVDKSDRKQFQFQFITGKRDRNKKCWYGIVRALRDPSMVANKVLTQIIHILNSNAKGGLMYESDAFENVRDVEKNWANPQKSIRLTPGALAAGKIKERTPPPMPPVLSELMKYSVAAIPDVTGVNVEMMGVADRDQPAALEASRKQSAITILAPFFDSLRRYRKNQGVTLLGLLRLLTPGMMVRITQDENEMFAPFDPQMFNLDDETLRFDVIVDEAPSAPNQKEAVWNTLTQMMNQGLEVPPQIMAELLQYSPLPSSVAQKVTAIIQQLTQQQPPMPGMPPQMPQPPMQPPMEQFQ